MICHQTWFVDTELMRANPFSPKYRVNADYDVLRTTAKVLNLDIAKLQRDMQAPEVQAALQENVGLGDKLGLSGTPAFIIGDEIIPGAVGVEPIRKTVAGVRQCGHATC